MGRLVTVEFYSRAVQQRSAVFEAFDGCLPVAGRGGMLHAFGVADLVWEDSCMCLRIWGDSHGGRCRRVLTLSASSGG